MPGSALRSDHWAGGDAVARETVKAGVALRLLTGQQCAEPQFDFLTTGRRAAERLAGFSDVFL